MTPSKPLLELAGITKRYDAPGGPGTLAVLDGISLEVRRGESLAVVGPSGSGKSTLLQIMGTLDQPTSGVVSWTEPTWAGLTKPRWRRCGTGR